MALRFDDLGLSPEMLDSAAKMGYRTPTPVQEKAIPPILAGRDVMIASQTGTGKTAAFVLPALTLLKRAGAGEGPHMLVLVPTRELAKQVGEVCASVGCCSGLRTVTIFGGVGYDRQREQLLRGCDVLVATPGRLIDLMEQGTCTLKNVRILVLDEADRMLDMGFLPSCERIVRKVPAARQTLLLSATLTDEVLRSTGGLVHDPVRVDMARKDVAAKSVTQYVLRVAPEAKKRALVGVLRAEESRRVIVFVRGKHRATHLSNILNKKGFVSAPIHGDRTQGQRTWALRQFASGDVQVLVATDVLARGVDIADVSYVVNMDVPQKPQDYVHRIGRTGRAGEVGWALTLCADNERASLRKIERFIGKEMDPYPHADGIGL